VNLSESTRAYIYRTLIALGGLAAAYGLGTGQEVALWVGLAGVVLNLLPTANTSTSRRVTAEAEADAYAARNDRSVFPYA
jgi:hypothetical protein